MKAEPFFFNFAFKKHRQWHQYGVVDMWILNILVVIIREGQK